MAETSGNEKKENSDLKHWNQVDRYWCTFLDQDCTQLINAVPERFFSEPSQSSLKKILLPITDIRVKDFLERFPSSTIPREPEEQFIQYLTLSSIDDLYRLAHQFDTGTPKPLYRGQSDYSWGLLTPLERNRPEFVVKESGLEIHEYDVLCQSQRRFHEFLTQLPNNDDRLSWLALLRHRGVPTRLLDVTRSLWIACYFALRDAKPNDDVAVWIFSRAKIEHSFWEWSRGANQAWLRSSPTTTATYGDYIRWPFPNDLQKKFEIPTIETLKAQNDPFNDLNFTLTLDAAMRGFVDKPGVAVVEPFWLSRRMDFQQGAFLIPFNVRYDFEFNLFTSLGMYKVETEERNVPTDVNELGDLWYHFRVIKLRIPAELHGILKIKLETMNIRDLTLFPDIDGALSHLTSLVPQDR